MNRAHRRAQAAQARRPEQPKGGDLFRRDAGETDWRKIQGVWKFEWGDGL